MGGDLWLVWELDGEGWGEGYILVRAGNKMGGCLDGRTDLLLVGADEGLLPPERPDDGEPALSFGGVAI